MNVKSIFMEGSKAMDIVNKTWLEEEVNISKEIQTKRLNKVLKNALSNIPAYFKYRNYEYLTPEDLLKKIAPINKKIVLDNYQDYVSDLVDESNCYITQTSGSTGVPFTVIHDNGVKVERMKTLLHILNKNEVNEDIRILVISGKKMDFNIKTENENPNVDIGVINLNGLVEEFDIALLKKIENFSPNVISGHGSEIVMFYKILQRNNYHKIIENISIIICGGESLSQQTQDFLSKSYKAKVVDSYGMSEIGDIALQCDQYRDCYHINEENVYLEVKDKDGIISEDSVEGEFILTGLDNEYMPLIRYQTSDMGTVSTSCKCGHKGKTIRILEGRKVNPIVLQNGELLNAYILKRKLEKLELLCYQIIQNKPGIVEIKIVKSDKSPNNIEYFKQIILDLVKNNLEIYISFNKIEELKGTNGKVKSFLCNLDIEF